MCPIRHSHTTKQIRTRKSICTIQFLHRWMVVKQPVLRIQRQVRASREYRLRCLRPPLPQPLLLLRPYQHHRHNYPQRMRRKRTFLKTPLIHHHHLLVHIVQRPLLLSIPDDHLKSRHLDPIPRLSLHHPSPSPILSQMIYKLHLRRSTSLCLLQRTLRDERNVENHHCSLAVPRLGRLLVLDVARRRMETHYLDSEVNTIQCGHCQLWSHTACVETQFGAISKDLNNRWICNRCRGARIWNTSL